MLSKNSSVSLLERLAEIVVEMEQRFRARLMHGHVADVQPLPGEVVDQRLRLRIGEHALDLRLHDLGLLKCLLHRQVDELVIGNAAPQEERQPRRKIEVAHPVRLRVAGSRLALNPEQELRADEDAANRHLDARVEPVLARRRRDSAPSAHRDRPRSPAGGRRGVRAWRRSSWRTSRPSQTAGSR